MLKSALLAAMLLTVQVSVAQNFPAPPAAAETSASDAITSEFENDAVPHEKTADKSFWTWSGLAVGVSGADLAGTAYRLNTGAGRELNPLFGPHPSMGRLFGTSVPILAAQMGMTYYLKKHHQNWKLSPKASLVTHAVGFASSLIPF